MTLPLPGIERLPSAWLEERAGRDLSQWFTPDHLALRVAVWGLAGSQALTILEPSAGGGALVRAARMARPSARVLAYEIDPYWARRLGAEEPSACILEADALTVKWPTVDAVRSSVVPRWRDCGGTRESGLGASRAATLC